MSSIVYGVEIEGFGRVANLPLATRLSTVRHTSATAEYYDLLHVLPRSMKTEIDIEAGSASMGGITIQTSRLDETSLDGIGKELLRFAILAGPRTRDLSLTSPLLAATTTVFTVNVLTGGLVPVIDTVIFFGREAMRVTNVTGSGAARILTVDRGIFGTEAGLHDRRDPYIYVEQNPLPTDRLVALYEVDLIADTEAVIWRGVIDELPRLVDGTVLLEIPVSDQFSMMSDQRLGVGRWRGRLRLVRPADGGNPRRIVASLVDPHDTPYLPPPFLPAADWTPPGIHKQIPVKLGGAVVGIQANEASPHPSFPGTYRHSLYPGALKILSGQEPDVGNQFKEFEVFELLVSARSTGASMFKDADGDVTEHPADLIRCLLASSGGATWTVAFGHLVGPNGDYDWLPGYWGGDIPDDQIDHPAFDALREDFPTASMIAANLYLGEDEKSLPTLWETCSQLAVCMGAYLLLTHDAKISIRRLGAPLPTGVDATLTDDDILWIKGQGLRVESSPWDVRPLSEIELEIGSDGPGGKPRQIMTGADFLDLMGSRYRYSAKRERIRETKVLGPLSTGRLAGVALEDLAEVFRARWIMLQQTPPVYDLETPEGAPRVVAGYWIGLTASGLIELDYTRGVTDHLALVLSADYDLTTRTQRLRILDWTALIGVVKPVAPAWKIDAVDSDVEFSLEPDYFSGDLSDATHWQDGSDYLVDLYTQTGVLRSIDGPTWGTASGEDITLDDAWRSATVRVTPLPGDIIRIAAYDDVGLWDHSYISDSAGLLGTADDDGTNWSP